MHAVRWVSLVVLVAGSVALAAPDTPVTLSWRDVPVAEALADLAEAGEIAVVVDPTLTRDRRITAEFGGVTAEQALRRLVATIPGAELVLVEDVWLVKRVPRPVTTPPAAPPRSPLPVRPAVVSEPVGTTPGQPLVRSSDWVKIVLNYLPAAGLAQILGGRPLYYSDIDPWAWGPGNLGRSGTGPRPLNANRGQTGTGLFQMPEGVEELVGRDWTNDMLAR